MTGESRQAAEKVQAMLQVMWEKSRATIEERVHTLQSATEKLAQNALDTAGRKEAESAAHKLAGILGTFGLTRGTILAREAEMLYSGDSDPASAPQLTQIAAQLRAMIAERT